MASASSGERVANSKGRAISASASKPIAAIASNPHKVSRLTASRLPNRIAVASVALAVYRYKNSTPNPSARDRMTPTATSRLRSRSPRTPIATAAAKVKASSPQSAPMPSKTEPVAPAKPTCESAWPAKARLRSTRKYPTAPATIATTPPAIKAVRMKS